MIYVVKMREYNKAAGCLRKNWTSAKWSIRFTAGDATPKRPFKPSPYVEVTKEQYLYLTGRDAMGNPNVAQPRSPAVPVFQGYKMDSRRALIEFVQREADQRAARGRTSARALTQFRGPIETAAQLQQELPIGKQTTDVVPEVVIEDHFEPVEISDGDGELDSTIDEPGGVDAGDEDEPEMDEEAEGETTKPDAPSSKRRVSRRRTKKTS